VPPLCRLPLELSVLHAAPPLLPLAPGRPALQTAAEARDAVPMHLHHCPRVCTDFIRHMILRYTIHFTSGSSPVFDLRFPNLSVRGACVVYNTVQREWIRDILQVWSLLYGLAPHRSF